ncbi:hypothetical protein LTR93_011351 [Exophiala xenobiotica]|nr:hypothetical protein LTR93_011351 [Exophiala xenobiotica]
MNDPNNAANVTIPMLMIPSGEEEKDAAGQKVEWYHAQVHGFMAARSNLEDEKVKAAYEKAYKTLLTWFHIHNHM